jgi:hypothetical protein
VDLTQFDPALKDKFKIDSSQILQERQIFIGKFENKPAFGKFYYYDATKMGGKTAQEIEDIKWNYHTIKDATQFHKLLSEVESETGLNLGVPKLFSSGITEESAYQIIELIDGVAIKYTDLSMEDVSEIVKLLKNWRAKSIGKVIEKNKDVGRWYFDSYDKATKWLESTFERGRVFDGITGDNNESNRSFLERNGMYVVIKAYEKFIKSTELKNLIEKYQNTPTLQHSDIIAGWIERDDKSKNYSGNIMKDKDGKLYIIDYDWAAISENILISLYADVVKLDFYLFDQPEKSEKLKTEAMKQFADLGYDLDHELSWNIYTFLQGVLWELPYWIRVFEKQKDESKIAKECFDWLMGKVVGSAGVIVGW